MNYNICESEWVRKHKYVHVDEYMCVSACLTKYNGSR